MRGITPILSTVMLLIIGIAVSAVFFYWYNNFQKSLQAKVERQAEEELEQYGYKIEVEEVFCNSSSGNITIFIRNVGDKTIPSGDAYIFLYDSNYSYITSFSIEFPGLSPNRVYVMNVTYTALQAGEVYYVKVTVPKFPQGSIGSCEAV